MANMSYCRCETTYNDLLDVYNEADESELSETELKYLIKLAKLSKKFADRFDDLIE